MSKKISIPQPEIAPYGLPITARAVEDVWNTFVNPDQLAGDVQSVEMRTLIGILRAVFAGLDEETKHTAPAVQHNSMRRWDKGKLELYCSCGWGVQGVQRLGPYYPRDDVEKQAWLAVHMHTASGQA